MRKLMCFTIGFTLACALGIYLLSGIWIVLVGLFCLLAGVGVLFLQSKSAKITAVILLGCVVGFAWQGCFEHFYLSTAKAADGQTQQITVTASDYGFIPTYGEAFDGELELDGNTYRVRCYLKSHYGVKPGDRISGEFHLRYTSAGGQSDPTYHQGKGIFLLAYAQGEISLETADSHRLQDYPALLRHKIQSHITNMFPEDTFAFAKALLLGDTVDFTYQQERAFQVSGLRHVVAVSGLHVAILFSVLYLFVGRNRWLVPLLGIPMLALFAAIAGFTPSVVRACVMQALISLSMLFQKEYDPPTALSAAVLVILGVNPVAITAVGFQLSVSCMLGIFLFSEKLRLYLLSFGGLQQKSKGKSLQAKLLRWSTGSVAVSLSAMVFTVPLCAIYFDMVSLVGVLANLLTLWIVSFIFYGIMLVCLVGFAWPVFGSILAGIISWPIRYVQWISAALSKLPFAAVYTDSVYIVAWLVLSYVILTVFFLCRRKHPGFTTAAIAILLAVSLGFSWLEPNLYQVQASVIDVGQGQSILLKSGKEYYLVDCGSTAPELAAETTVNYLLSQGIFRLDGLILTHYDIDHAGAVPYLLRDIRVSSLYMPNVDDSNGIRQIIETSCTGNGILVTDILKLKIPDGNIQLIPAQNPQSDNESSMCVLFQSGDCDILITGDRGKSGERKLLEQIALPELDILVVGHHGSHYATSNELLETTRPRLALISVGDNNYGHPHWEVLECLQIYGCSIHRTDLQGTIVFRR